MATPNYVAFYNAHVNKTGWHNDCGIYARESFGVESDGAGSAAAQWKEAKKKHAGDKNAPAGSLVYWTGGASGAGHVAVVLDAKGNVACPDFNTKGYVGDGKIHKSTIAAISTDSNLKYVGWAEDIDGVTVYHAPAPAPKPTPAPKLVPYPGASHFKLGHSDPAVTQLGQWMLKAGKTPYHAGDVYVPGPVYSSFDVANVKAYQQAEGFKGADADGYPGETTWNAIQKAAGA